MATSTASKPTTTNGPILGTSGNDTLTGTSGNDIINGFGGNDSLYGLDGNDTLNGGDGDDLLDGGAGADNMIGGTGNDTFIVDNTGDKVQENANEGTDLVKASITYTLPANVENLTLTGTAPINGTGNTLDNVLTGNSAVNTLTGGAGNDTLNGGGGADTLIGGTGDDTYIVDDPSVKIVENVNEGTDVVNASVSYTLPDNVENLTLTGNGIINGTGNALDNTILGNDGNNTLLGGDGNDTLTGGKGDDVLDGGPGNDILRGSANYPSNSYAVADGNDTYVFAKGGGQDSIIDYDTSSGYTDTLRLDGLNPSDVTLSKQGNDLLVKVNGTSDQVLVSQQFYYADGGGSAYANEGIEQIQFADGTVWNRSTLEGKTGPQANVINGDNSDNTLYGTAGNDLIHGYGGNDTIYSYANGASQYSFNGNDTLYGDDGNDTLQGAKGNDTLYGGAGDDTLIGDGWSDSTGGDDYLDGGDGNDTLYGFGGHDTLLGGAGNDTIYLDLTSTSFDTADGGTDNGGFGDTMILSSGSQNGTVVVDLSNSADQLTSVSGVAETYAQTNFESVYAAWSGTGGLYATGSDAANSLTGSGNADTLLGGAGDDQLLGGLGADLFSGGSGQNAIYNGAGTSGGDDGATDRDMFKWADRTYNDLSLGRARYSNDLIYQFDTAAVSAGGDVLDISDLLKSNGVDTSTINASNIGDYVQMTTDSNGTDTDVLIDADGAANGQNFTKVAQLDHVGGVTAAGMFQNGNIDVNGGSTVAGAPAPTAAPAA